MWASPAVQFPSSGISTSPGLGFPPAGLCSYGLGIVIRNAVILIEVWCGICNFQIPVLWFALWVPSFKAQDLSAVRRPHWGGVFDAGWTHFKRGAAFLQ